MKNILILSIFLSLFALFGCQKKPSASFTTTKAEYTPGESVYCRNTTKDGYSYLWMLNGPATELRSSEKDVTFQLSGAGSYEITLTAYNRNGKLSHKISKTIVAKYAPAPAVQQVTFYSNNIYNSQITIYIDNVFKGYITQQYITTPTCGATGCLTTQITAGAHSVTAYLFSSAYYYNINIGSTACTVYAINP